MKIRYDSNITENMFEVVRTYHKIGSVTKVEKLILKMDNLNNVIYPNRMYRKL